MLKKEPRTPPSPFAEGVEAVWLERDVLDRVALLKRTRWGDVFTHMEYEVLSERMTAWELPEQTLLFHEGDPATFMAFVVHGGVEVARGPNPFTQAVLARLLSGETFGEMAMIDPAPRSATVYTSQRSKLLVLDKSAFDELSRDEPLIAFKLVRRLALALTRRLRMTSSELIAVLTDDQVLD